MKGEWLLGHQILILRYNEKGGISMIGVIVLSSICILSAILLWNMADKRGANRLFWATMGALFGPFAIPFIFLANRRSSK